MTTRDSFSGSYGSGSSSPGGGSYTEPLPTGVGASGDAVQQAKDKAGEVVDQAQQKTGEVVDQAKQQAASQLSVQKDRAAEGLGSVADALRQSLLFARMPDAVALLVPLVVLAALLFALARHAMARAGEE